MKFLQKKFCLTHKWEVLFIDTKDMAAYCQCSECGKRDIQNWSKTFIPAGVRKARRQQWKKGHYSLPAVRNVVVVNWKSPVGTWIDLIQTVENTEAFQEKYIQNAAFTKAYDKLTKQLMERIQETEYVEFAK